MAQHDAIIIGAGIAGAALAHSLRQAGRDVLVLEANTIASAASGNPKGLFKPWLSLGDNPMRQFYTAAYHHALPLLAELGVPILHQGTLQLPTKPDDSDRFRRAPQEAGFDAADLQYLSPREASDTLGLTVTQPCLWWGRAAVISPPTWVRALLGDANVLEHHPVTALEGGAEWHCITPQKTFSARQVFIAAGYGLTLLPQLAAHLRPKRGQITQVPAARLPVAGTAVSFGHYWIPANGADDFHILGATYVPSPEPILTNQGHSENLSALCALGEILPEVAAAAAHLTAQDCQGRAAIRATTAHHLPLWGMGAENLYYLTGLGSRGMLSAPYAARRLWLEIEAEK